MNPIHAATLLAVAAGLILSGTVAVAGDPPRQPKARAAMIDGDGDAVGTVTLVQGPNGVLINLDLDNLPPGPKAIHIHTVGTCEDHDHGFQDSAGHLNPDDRKHGLLNPDGPDPGDLPNFHVHADGTARAQFFNGRASLDGSVGAAILDKDGAALVIHESADDHFNQPIGGAGARIACGVIKAYKR